jgi:muramoyltetrapeptide carboxypeptidase
MIQMRQFKIFILLIVCFLFNIHLNAQNTKMTKQLISPAYLKSGDTISIVASAGGIKNKDIILKAAKLAESWGLHVLLGKHLFGSDFSFSGTDAERLEDFQKALDDKSVKAIWCARGGYGTVRIIDGLDFTGFKKNPKWIIGYSDITVLHSHIHNLGYETFHAMMPLNMKVKEEERLKTLKTFKKALFGKHLKYKIVSSPRNRTGEAQGQLVGGNLSILQSLLGSVSSINTTDKILFFEDVEEYLYNIDRMVYALKRSGYFKNCRGLIIGGMTDLKKNSNPFGRSIEDIVLEATKDYHFPVLFNFPAGHDADNRALILGRTVKIKVSKKHSVVDFSR